jgi:transposase
MEPAGRVRPLPLCLDRAPSTSGTEDPEMTQEQKIIRAKVGLLELARQLGNVSQACKMLGYRRDSFYRFKERYDKGGELALAEMSRRKPVLKNRTPLEVEEAVVAVAIEQPAWGQVRVAEAVKRRGLTISPAEVHCVWQRHDLETSKKRLKTLETKSAQDGLVLCEAQIAALERARAENEAHGEFESECPGYCGAQDTFYVGTMKGVGRIYQQTFIDTYAKVAFAKLYDCKTPITAADLLNDRVRALLRRARGQDEPRADRPRHRILRQPRAARVSALPRRRGHQPYADEDEEPANQWDLREVPPWSTAPLLWRYQRQQDPATRCRAAGAVHPMNSTSKNADDAAEAHSVHEVRPHHPHLD